MNKRTSPSKVRQIPSPSGHPPWKAPPAFGRRGGVGVDVGVGRGACVEVFGGLDVGGIAVGAMVVGVGSRVGNHNVGLRVGNHDVGRGEGCNIGALSFSAATTDRPVKPTRKRVPTVKSVYAVICILGIFLSLFSIRIYPRAMWLRLARPPRERGVPITGLGGPFACAGCDVDRNGAIPVIQTLIFLQHRPVPYRIIPRVGKGIDVMGAAIYKVARPAAII